MQFAKNELIINDENNLKKHRAGETIIKQGDDGDELYVVDSGSLDCFKEKANNERLYLKTYKEGEAFGNYFS